MITTHQGAWSGINRLWLDGPVSESSQGTAEVEPLQIQYTWTFREKAHTGVVKLSGPAASLRADWSDTFHYPDGAVMHGRFREGLLKVYGTYPAGDGPDWGWQIEVDLRDPETFVLQMFNVEPGSEPVIAVDLRGTR